MEIAVTTYTVERATEFTDEIRLFFIVNGPTISKLFDDKLNYQYTNYEAMVKKGIFLVGRRNGEMRGYHVSFLGNHVLDQNVKVIQQQTFYVKPDSGRMAYHLFQKFIDIGKSEANHIITMLARQTNIKPSTLKRWGFVELEVLYRMENP
jgi:hypothetical protein